MSEAVKARVRWYIKQGLSEEVARAIVEREMSRVISRQPDENKTEEKS
jgi:hypothetical protein